jgi:hypothetical protein
LGDGNLDFDVGGPGQFSESQKTISKFENKLLVIFNIKSIGEYKWLIRKWKTCF